MTGMPKTIGEIARLLVPFLILTTLSDSPAHSQDQPKRRPACDLALVLAVDLSASVNMWEYNLQTQGLSAAFRHPLVIDAIQSVGPGGIWVTLVHWSGVDEQIQSVPWTRITDTLSSHAFSAAIASVRRPYNDASSEGIGSGTALGAALHFSAPLFASAGPDRCNRRVIDVSGDGRSNVGPKITPARDALLALGLTINGLAILSDEPDLDDYYGKHVIGGPAAFVMSASNHQSFAVAMRNKLFREIVSKLAYRQPVPRHIGWSNVNPFGSGHVALPAEN